MTVNISCPLCRSSQFSLFRVVRDHYSGERFNIVRCGNCTHRYINPSPLPEELERYYASNISGDSMRRPPMSIFRAMQRVSFWREISRFRNYLGDADRVADIGAGDGSLSRYLRDIGYSVGACDYYPKEDWNELQIPYASIDLQNPSTIKPALWALFGAEPKLVIFRHVLEHILDPVKVLTACREIDVRYIYLIVPNCDSFAARSFGEYWYYWDPPRHLQFFNLQTLAVALQQARYRIIGAGHFGLDEIVTSVHRWTNIQMASRKEQSIPLKFLSEVTRPKGLFAGVSSAVQAPFGKAVCWCVAERE